MISIQDPVHGTIEVTPAEIKLIDSMAFQRLRHIKQLGFTELAFPGATHSRYTHSLGAMHMATRIAERVLGELNLGKEDFTRLRETVRLAMLFHDLGHAPMSHVSEQVMPQVSALKIDEWGVGDSNRQASHEDYTVKLLVDSELTQLIEKQMGDIGVSGARLAALISGREPPGDKGAFKVDGVNLLPILSQLVSSELDADRMDYLRRDAYYAGVPYGAFDHEWLVRNITAVQHEGQWVMALLHKGVWAFEDFLLSRYHMFLAVYYHHTAIGFDQMLGRFYAETEYQLPADVDAYVQADDVQLIGDLRASKNEWARLVVERRPYRLALETHGYSDEDVSDEVSKKLRDEGVDFFAVRSRGVLSKYFKKREKVFPLLVVEPELGRQRRIEDYTPLYKRYEDVVAISRIYCSPKDWKKTRQIVAENQGENK
ncbi:HD domain-containing protein [Myxococcota bacterium]|nr:HD domain-containing protein [Myxococcota bacterium]